MPGNSALASSEFPRVAGVQQNEYRRKDMAIIRVGADIRGRMNHQAEG